MTRRERHKRILESFGRDRVWRALRDIPTWKLVDLLSDEGVEMTTRRIVTDHKRQQKFNAENRARRAEARNQKHAEEAA